MDEPPNYYPLPSGQTWNHIHISNIKQICKHYQISKVVFINLCVYVCVYIKQ